MASAIPFLYVSCQLTADTSFPCLFCIISKRQQTDNQLSADAIRACLCFPAALFPLYYLFSSFTSRRGSSEISTTSRIMIRA